MSSIEISESDEISISKRPARTVLRTLDALPGRDDGLDGRDDAPRLDGRDRDFDPGRDPPSGPPIATGAS